MLRPCSRHENCAKVASTTHQGSDEAFRKATVSFAAYNHNIGSYFLLSFQFDQLPSGRLITSYVFLPIKLPRRLLGAMHPGESFLLIARSLEYYLLSEQDDDSNF